MLQSVNDVNLAKFLDFDAPRHAELQAPSVASDAELPESDSKSWTNKSSNQKASVGAWLSKAGVFAAREALKASMYSYKHKAKEH